MGIWISIKNRKPNIGQWVLIMSDNSEQAISVYWSKDINSDNVRYWMPLTRLPNVKRNKI